MERKDTALLLIDPQNDFCDSENGALGVSGAEEDCKKIYNDLITGYVDNIFVTMDTHYPFDISHPVFWTDKDGYHPEPLTVIKSSEIGDKWYPAEGYEEWAKRYVKILEEQGEYDHIIWPEHCAHGSWGHMLNSTISKGLAAWSRAKKKNYNVIEKGKNPFTEHFGAFQSQVEISGHPDTFFNKELLNHLKSHSKVHLAGEAESHCVAYTLHQINQLEDTEINQKLVVHKNCMSPVQGFEGVADGVFNKASERGSEIIE